jgi:hypothetical protein
MRSVIAAAVVSLALSAFAGAQEGEKKKDGKKEPSLSLKEIDLNGDGRASVTEIKIAIAKLTPKEDKKDGENRERRRDGDGNRERKEKGAQEPSIVLKDLDTSSDGRAQLSELQAALESLTKKKDGGDKKEGGDKK